MPKREDIKSILLIGSGPIVIGQACEFDYSGTQACRVLKEEGYRVILANSNPATIMTDPDFADATYIEPLRMDVIKRIIEKEKPDALLPTLGGQTALNLARELAEEGILEENDVELIGADAEAIATAEDREKFKIAMTEIGLRVPASGVARNIQEAHEIVKKVELPVIIRPAYILGGKGTGIASTNEEFEKIASRGIEASPINEILIEKSIAGWKEFELEVMRDKADNCVVICSIENLDPMGVHTGDSITVAPAQTLTDFEYQIMRDAAFACLRRVGVETGGSNVQFAVNPDTGEQVVIEMNPRVSRSSALASKATGFPIAKIATQLAIGYTLDEITNDITKETPASFEPSIDYVVTKIPRWTFEKFPGSSGVLGTSMQSVGEVMSIGRTFPESLQKGMRSLENGRQAIDPWFIDQISMITEERASLEKKNPQKLSTPEWKRAKQLGFSDSQLAYLWESTSQKVRELREKAGVLPTFKTVDTCAAEFASETPYHYSTWEDETEVLSSDRPKVIILGAGPNRIGQGIEFDYCCVHASFALSEAGYETVMVNCNPETVSTDYDTSDRLYFEPLTHEDVVNVIDAEKPEAVIVSLGGQTPLKLAGVLPPQLIAGTSPDSIDRAEDRENWNQLCSDLGILQPPGGTAKNFQEALQVAKEVSYPVLVRPSYVLGGRAMEIVYDDDQLEKTMEEMTRFGSLGIEGGLSAERPVLIDQFLEDATEVDVDAVRDHKGKVLIGAVMEHVEEAGIHSGDSACVIPPPNLKEQIVELIESHTRKIAEALDVKGLINVQYAVKGDEVYVIEANPRASRTVPFVAKATGMPLAKIASRVMLGSTLEELSKEGLRTEAVKGDHVSVKEAVLPFNRFPEADPVLGPEMRSTGEVMGVDLTSGLAFAKSQISAGGALPTEGTVFMSLADRDKSSGLEAAKGFLELGLEIVATGGTADYLTENGVEVSDRVAKIGEEGTDAVRLIRSGKIQLVVNSPRGRGPRADGDHIRGAAAAEGIPLLTTAAAALAAVKGLKDWNKFPLSVRSLQEYHLGVSKSEMLESQ